MTSPRPDAMSDAPDCGFSPVENEPPLRWFRRLRLVPRDGLGAGRRAVLFASLAWLPIVLWSATAGRLFDAGTGEPLLQHYGVHVRCLLAIPLLVLGEASMHATVQRLTAQFVSSGIVGPGLREAFGSAIDRVRRLRDASLPWVLLIGVAIAWSIADHPAVHEDALSWALDADGRMGFGGAWFAFVVRPLFLALLLGWLWRILLVACLLWRIGRLDLSLVPTHPDRTGGMAFVEKLPGAFSLVSFALSAVIASGWAHEVVHHGAALRSFMHPAAAFAILWTMFALLPLMALAPALFAARARAIPGYSALIARQGRLVHRRWILREPVDDERILDAPEIGPVADAASLYEAVRRMRVVPVGKAAILKVLVPIAVPLLVVAAVQVPLKDLMMKLVKTLI